MNAHDSRLRIVLTASTSGSVLGACLNDRFFRERVVAVVCDRDCGAAEVARGAGIPAVVCVSTSAEGFADQLDRVLPEFRPDYLFSFSTRFYPVAFRSRWIDRIVNFHPTLLPAFPGNDAWEYVRHYGVRLAGSTVEFIHERMDAGKIIQQTCFPWDPDRPQSEMRHRLFVHQCRSVLQLARWLEAGRVRTEGHQVRVEGGRHDDPACCPAWEDPEVMAFDPPPPVDRDLSPLGGDALPG